MEGQEKEIGQLRKQIKHLEEKERVANDSVFFSSFLLCCFKYTSSLNKVGTMRQACNSVWCILKVEGLMMDVAAAEEEIKRWKMAAEEEADAGRSIEQEFQIQVLSYTNTRYIVACSFVLMSYFENQ